MQRGAEELTSGLQLDAGWESASACLKAALEGAFSGGTVSATLLAAKDFVLLACSALGAAPHNIMHTAKLQSELHRWRALPSSALIAGAFYDVISLMSCVP